VSSEPLAVINFRDRIRQLLWHPIIPENLLILTNQRQPSLYQWHAAKQQILFVPGYWPQSDLEPEEYGCEWLQDDSERTSLLLMSSSHRYDVGVIDIDQDDVIFQSVLRESLNIG
jgi:hypothetical protein